MLTRTPPGPLSAAVSSALATVLCAFLALVVLASPQRADAKAPIDIRGSWHWVSTVGSQTYPQTLTIRTQDFTTGKVTGTDKGRSGAPLTDVTGRLSGTRLTLDFDQRGSSYTAHIVGTVVEKNGKRLMSGTFTDSGGQRGTFTAKAGASTVPDASPTPTPTPTATPEPSPTPSNGKGYDDPPHNLHLGEKPPVCTDPSLVTWGPDSINRPRYLLHARYRPCLVQLNPGTGSVSVSYEATLTKWGSEWDRYRVDTSGGVIDLPDGHRVTVNVWDFGTQSACFLSECSPLYPWYNPFQLYWSADDSRIEWVPVVTGTEVLPTNPDTGPQYARTVCVVDEPCEILVQRPPALEQGVPYWVRLSAFGYCVERYTGVQGGCGIDEMTATAREFVVEAHAGGSAVGPTAAFSAAQVDPGSPWVFDASASSASAPATLVRWDWDLGDHTKTSGPTPTHAYAVPGRYHVTLTVTDSIGRTATATQDIGEADTRLVVNSSGDSPRGPQAGDACDTGEKIDDTPECTLRAAIETANTRDGASRITFSIAGDGIPVIRHSTRYPTLGKPVVIDGTSQPGGWVQLQGSSEDAMAGLTLGGGSSRVTGLVISGFAPGLLIAGDGNIIEGNRIGTDATGARADPGISGIALSGTTNTTIRDNVVAGRYFAVRGQKGAIATVTGNHIGVSEAGADFSTQLGIYVAPSDGGGAWTITDNTIAATHFGILMRGPSGAGSTISGNTVALPPVYTNYAPVGVMLDGTPGATISDNKSIVAAGGYDILVTGAAQAVDNATGATISLPEKAVAGAVTGGDVTIRNNTLGLDAGGSLPGTIPAERSRFGIVVYGAASSVRVEGDLIAGHKDLEVRIIGGAGHQVTGNDIGVNRAGTAALGSANGLLLESVTDVLVQGNLISGLVGTAIAIRADPADPAHPDSRNVTVTGNRIGTANDTRVALHDEVGIAVGDSEHVVIGPGNVVSGNTFGITAAATAKGLVIEGNTVGADRGRTTAVPNEIGIEVGAPGARITDNRVLANTGVGIQIESGTATLDGNVVGVGANGKPLGNKVGVFVWAGATAILANDTVANSAQDGIHVEARAMTWVLHGSMFANGGKGIGAPGAGAAPTLKVVDFGSGANARRWFVISGMGTRVAQVYGNVSCGDPDEGTAFLVTRSHGFGPDDGVSQVYSTSDGRTFPAYTATVTDTVTGSTSEFSACATPARYPDTSGTGIPDIVQTGLGGDPTLPATVRFPAAAGSITLETVRGRFANVSPLGGVAAPAGVSFPIGPFTFQILGLAPGGATTVLLTSSEASFTSYWRYGRVTPTAPLGWYHWIYDPTTATGPRGSGKEWRLDFVDGGPGDDDGLANGVVQDPSGPAVGGSGEHHLRPRD